MLIKKVAFAALMATGLIMAGVSNSYAAVHYNYHTTHCYHGVCHTYTSHYSRSCYAGHCTVHRTHYHYVWHR